MLILTIRTDKPEAEIGLFEDNKKLSYETWPAHRQLAETIHKKIKELLKSQKHALNNLEGLIVFKGPGSFTGLRIGISVANALADGLQIPLIGESGESWSELGIDKLKKGKDDKAVIPKYGAPVRTTKPKH